MIVRYRARALADIESIYRYLEPRSPSGARNVLWAIHSSVESIVEQPFAYVQTDDPNVRVMSVRRYRYRIFYSVVGETVEILHIRHTSRQAWP